MNLKAVTALTFSLIALILTGCSSVQPTPASVATTFPSLTPEPAISSTAAPLPSLTPTPIPSSTPIPAQKLSQTCVTSDKTNKAKIALHGIAVFDNLVPLSVESAIETVYLRDLEKSTIKILPTLGPFEDFIGISPDRKKLLYEYDSQSTDDYRLAVADSSGKSLVNFDNRLNGDRWDYFNWQDGESIRVVQHELDMAIPKLYNPFTQEYKSLRSDWSDLYVGDNSPEWELDDPAIAIGAYKGANIVYDPSITRVVYPKNGEIVSLTDVETGSELASAHFLHWGKTPRWSPDGENLVLIARVNASDEFFSVSKDGGEFKQLTNLGSSFEKITVVKYAWSPNGEQIVFLFNTDTVDIKDVGMQSELAILNVKTNEIANLCFPSISAITYLEMDVNFVDFQPVWSPDGTQILLAQWEADSSEKKRKYGVWVVDVPSLTAVKIDENKQPAGWMIKIP